MSESIVNVSGWTTGPRRTGLTFLGTTRKTLLKIGICSRTRKTHTIPFARSGATCSRAPHSGHFVSLREPESSLLATAKKCQQPAKTHLHIVDRDAVRTKNGYPVATTTILSVTQERASAAAHIRRAEKTSTSRNRIHIARTTSLVRKVLLVVDRNIYLQRSSHCAYQTHEIKASNTA